MSDWSPDSLFPGGEAGHKWPSVGTTGESEVNLVCGWMTSFGAPTGWRAKHVVQINQVCPQWLRKHIIQVGAQHVVQINQVCPQWLRKHIIQVGAQHVVQSCGCATHMAVIEDWIALSHQVNHIHRKCDFNFEHTCRETILGGTRPCRIQYHCETRIYESKAFLEYIAPCVGRSACR